jgi:hypothetical protein
MMCWQMTFRIPLLALALAALASATYADVVELRECGSKPLKSQRLENSGLIDLSFHSKDEVPYPRIDIEVLNRDGAVQASEQLALKSVKGGLNFVTVSSTLFGPSAHMVILKVNNKFCQFAAIDAKLPQDQPVHVQAAVASPVSCSMQASPENDLNKMFFCFLAFSALLLLIQRWRMRDYKRLSLNA